MKNPTLKEQNQPLQVLGVLDEKQLISNMSFKINNHTDLDLNALSGVITEFYPYVKEKLGFDKPVNINFMSDSDNAKDIFGKTAQYNPSKMAIDIFVDGRHPKDILRSLSHELVHHAQNCRGDFDKIGSTEPGYAQKDPFLRNLEAEAYLLGNGFLFRDFEDMRKSKMKNNTVNLKNMVRNLLNETINEYIDEIDDLNEIDDLDEHEDLDEEDYLDESNANWPYGASLDENDAEGDSLEDLDEADLGPKPKLPSNWRKLSTKDPARVKYRKWLRAKKASKPKRKKARKPKERSMKFKGSELPDAKKPKTSSAKMNKLFQQLSADEKSTAVAKAKSSKTPSKSSRADKKLAKHAEEIFGKSKTPKFPHAKKKLKDDSKITLAEPKHKVASAGQMAALMRAGKKEKRAVAKAKPTPSRPSPIGAPPGKTKIVKKKPRSPVNEASRKKSDKEWYQDTLFENLVEKWSK